MPKNKNMPEIPDDIKKLSFEEAYQALKEATDLLETEEASLEASLKEYSRASLLARHCANLLDKAENRIKVLIESEGVMQLTSLEFDESG
jgi:exodeoxyribonuclease VII small subunit